MSLGRLVCSATLPITARRVTYSPDGNLVAVAAAGEDLLTLNAGSVSSSSTRRPGGSAGHSTSLPAALEFTPDSQHLVISTQNFPFDPTNRQSLRLLRAENGGQVWMRPEIWAAEICVSPDGGLIAILRGNDLQLALLDTATGQPLHTLGRTSHFRFRPVFSADSQRVLIYADGAVRLINCASGQTEALLESPSVLQVTLVDIAGQIVLLRRDAVLARKHLNMTASAPETHLEGAAWPTRTANLAAASACMPGTTCA